ncbi:MAG: rhomboid family intramembrane serine protease [Opitutaceae bacterium]
MSDPAVQFEGDPPAAPGESAEAGVYPDFGSACDHGLVVLAMGLTYWLGADGRGYSLMVDPAHLDEVRDQLRMFDQESAGWPPVSPPRPARVSGAALSPCVWALATGIVFWVQHRSPGLLEQRGALDSQALFEGGEWWRPATALFLHANIGHLVSNLAGGLLVFTSVLNTLRLAHGWLALLAASVAGNVLAAAAHGSSDGYRSIGASTAVFAGIGLLTGHAVRAALTGRATGPWVRRLFVPLMAGLILLGWLGAGDWQTDVVAHATGFAAGIAVGLMVRGV